jgi:hypothetical protein
MRVLNSIWIREKCPRCGGNLYVEREEYGRLAIKCLMCARTINKSEIINPKHETNSKHEIRMTETGTVDTRVMKE